MTRLPFWLLLLALLILTPSARAEEPAPAPAPQGQVTLPLDEFLRLSRKTPPGGGAAAATVPVPFMYSQGRYRLSAASGWVQVHGTVSLQVYQTGWVEVPLLPVDVVVDGARLDGKPLSLYRKDGQFHFLADRVGAHTLEASWSLPVALSGATRSVVLKTPASSVSGVVLVLPGRGLEVTASPVIPLQKRSEGDRTVAEGAIPGGGSQQVTFSWTPQQADPALRGKASQEKARISGRVYDLVTVSETEVNCRIRVDYTILRNEVDRFTLRVPVGTEVDEVACANLANWTEQEKGGRKEILVKLSAPVSGSHSLTLTLVRALEKPDSTWTLPSLELVGTEQVKGSIGIGSTGGIEVQPGAVDQARPIDVSELPAEVREMASFALLRAYEYHRQPWSIALVTKKGKELPVLTAAVDLAEGLTLVTRDGKLVTSFTYLVRNNQKQSLGLKLPEGSTLFTTTLDGKPAKPVQGPGGEIRLSLVASGNGGQTAFPVEITYIQEPGGTSLWGRHQMQAPEVDLPVSVMNWTLYLPLDEWVYHLGGNMRPGLVHDAPENASPAPDDGEMEKDASERQSLRREVAQEEVLGNNKMSQMVQQASTGTLPVKFSIPTRGQAFQFSRLMVTDGEAPEVAIDFYSGTLQMLGAALAVALVLGIGLRQTRLEPLAIALVVLWVVRGWAADTPLEHILHWAIRGLYLLVALWVYRNRAWILARRAGPLVLALLLLTGSAARADEGPGGTVTLPLEDFVRLTAPAHPPGTAPAAPPQGHLFSNGRYRIEAGPEWAVVVGRLDLALYAPGWQEVPLLPSGTVLAEVTLDGKSVPVYEKDGFFRFLARGRGEHAVKVVYHSSVSARSFEFRSPPGAVASVRLVLPGTGLRVQAQPDAPLTSATQAGRTVVEAALPGGQVTRLTWSPRVADPGLHGQANREKARVGARVYTMAQVSEREVRCRSRVDCTIQHNEIDALVLGVPPGAEVVDLQCPNLAGWEVVDRAGVREVHVALSKPVTGSLPVDLTVELPLPNVNSTWEVPWVRVDGAERVKGSVGISGGATLELTLADEPQDARAIDPAELPPQALALGTAVPVLAYEYHDQTYSVRVESRLGQQIPLLTAAVDQGEGQTLVTPEGKTISTFTWHLRNNQNQYLEVRLPEGARIWSAFVDGRAVKPLEDGGALKLPLVSSQGSGPELASFPVEITFVGADAGGGWLGSQALQAPQLVGVPIAQLAWSVFLPDDRKVLGFGGTMEPSAETSSTTTTTAATPDAPPPARDKKEAAANEAVAPAPAAQAAGSVTDQLESGRADKPVESSMAQMVQTASTGSFPVRVRVPQAGRPYRFSQLMVGDERPTVEVRYYTPQLVQAGRWAALLVVLALGLGSTRRPGGWTRLAAGALALAMLGWLLAGTPGAALVTGGAWGLALLALLWLARQRRWLVDTVKTRLGRRAEREVPS